MTDRERQITAFLAASGWADATTQAMPGDASFRRYHRVRCHGRRAMLMDAPPGREDVRPFLRIARHLRGLGFSAPEVLAADAEAGLLLLEDFGDDTFTRLLADGGEEAALYRLAVDVLVHLHRLPAAAAIPGGLPAYDAGRLREEVLLLTDWYMPAVLRRPTDDAIRSSYVAAWDRVLTPLEAQPATLVLRDFHVDNLMHLAGREGLAACGLLDFQDAVAGPAAYDLMSLLEDARRDVGPQLKTEMLARYAAGMADADAGSGGRGGFEEAFAVLAAQRHAKVIGIFTRLMVRDGKPVYLCHIPRVWRLLEAALRHPSLAEVTRWFDRHLPTSARIAPTAGGERDIAGTAA